MKKHTLVIVALAGLFASASVVEGNPAGPPGGLDVTVVNEVNAFVTNTSVPTGEQNLDGNGDIKVHEQGTVQVVEQRVPFQKAISWDDWAGGDIRLFDVEIPPDKMLIVQTVSISALVESGQDVWATVTSQGSGVGLSWHPIPLTSQGTFDGLDLYVGTTSLAVYATGNSGLSAVVKRSSSNRSMHRSGSKESGSPKRASSRSGAGFSFFLSGGKK